MVPVWLTRQCVAFTFLIVLTGFLVVSLLTPWFKIDEVMVPYPTTSDNVTVDRTSTFGWTGVKQIIRPTDISKPQFTVTVPWSEFPTTKVEDTFFASMAMAVVSIILSVLLVVFVVFAQNCLQMLAGSKTKWIIFGISLVIILFVFLSWFLLFGLPDSMRDDEYLCPDETYIGTSVWDDAHKLWCSTFIGKKSNVGRFNSSYSWGPQTGWVLAIIASGWSFCASFFFFIVQPIRHQPLLGDEKYRLYH